jgi:hypothetical protein
MTSLRITPLPASNVEKRRKIMEPNRYVEYAEEHIRITEFKEPVKSCSSAQRKMDNVPRRLGISNTVGLESLPTEILRDMVDLLPLQDIKQLSCASKRLREICLPSLFRRVKFESS